MVLGTRFSVRELHSSLTGKDLYMVTCFLRNNGRKLVILLFLSEHGRKNGFSHAFAEAT